MSQLILPRRKFLAGLAATIAMPAIVRVESLMKLPRPERSFTPVPLFYALVDATFLNELAPQTATGEHLDRFATFYGVPPRYLCESDYNLRQRILSHMVPPYMRTMHDAASQ